MSFLTFWLTALVVWSQPGSATAATARDLTVLDAVIAQHVRAHAHPPVDTNWSHPWLVVFDRTYRFCDADLEDWCMPDETRAQLEEWIAQERDGASLNRAFVTRNHAVLTVSDAAPDGTVVADDDLEGLGSGWRIVGSLSIWQS